MLTLWRVKSSPPLQINKKFSGYCNREQMCASATSGQEYQLPYMDMALDPISVSCDPVRIQYYATLQFTVNISIVVRSVLRHCMHYQTLTSRSDCNYLVLIKAPMSGERMVLFSEVDRHSRSVEIPRGMINVEVGFEDLNSCE